MLVAAKVDAAGWGALYSASAENVLLLLNGVASFVLPIFLPMGLLRLDALVKTLVMNALSVLI
jgi:hypothetical protein